MRPLLAVLLLAASASAAETGPVDVKADFFARLDAVLARKACTRAALGKALGVKLAFTPAHAEDGYESYQADASRRAGLGRLLLREVQYAAIGNTVAIWLRPPLDLTEDELTARYGKGERKGPRPRLRGRAAAAVRAFKQSPHDSSDPSVSYTRHGGKLVFHLGWTTPPRATQVGIGCDPP